MKRILLVDDEVSVVNFITKGLAEDNYEVSVAFDGQSGIKMALEASFDLIILDIMLPDRNGLEVCKEIRANQIQTPILFLTALGLPKTWFWGSIRVATITWSNPLSSSNSMHVSKPYCAAVGLWIH